MQLTTVLCTGTYERAEDFMRAIAGGRTPSMAPSMSSETTTDHDIIRKWAENAVRLRQRHFDFGRGDPGTTDNFLDEEIFQKSEHEQLVAQGRIELPTPGSSGLRSTTELPGHSVLA